MSRKLIRFVGSACLWVVTAETATIAQQVAVAAAPIAIEKAPPGSVNIYRDDWGVAHIYAQREEDGFFGTGYAMAEDQLVNLLENFLLATGRASEALGRSPDTIPPYADHDDMVLNDAFVRLARFRVQAEEDYQKLTPNIRRNLVAYTRGVEAFMAANPEKVPAWWRKEWRLDPIDQLAMSAMIDASPEQGWPGAIGDCGLRKEDFFAPAAMKWDVAQELRGYSPFGTRPSRGSTEASAATTAAFTRPGTHSPGARAGKVGGQSSIWAYGPSRTKSGHPIISTDPHGGPKWAWEWRMDAGDVKLFALAQSIAYPATGHTRWQSWAWTTGGADAGDCYRIKLDGADGYRIDGKRRPIFSQAITFPVKGEAPYQGTIEHIMIKGVKAPVVARKDGYAYVVLTSYMRDTHLYFAQMDAQIRAKTTDEMVKASRMGGLSAFNQGSAGSDGSTFWISGGRVFERPAGAPHRSVVPYETSRVEPLGLLPSSLFVQQRDPKAGYWQNNNAWPAHTTPIEPPKREDYPPESYMVDTRDISLGLGDGVRFGRSERILELMNPAYQVTFEDAVKMALDTKRPWVAEWTRALGAAMVAEHSTVSAQSGEVQRFMRRAASFDGFGTAESMEQLAYFLWREELIKTCPGTTGDCDVEPMSDLIETKKPLTADQQRGLVRAAIDAARRMSAIHNTVDLRFGDVFRIERGGKSLPMTTADIPYKTRYRGDQAMAVGWFAPPNDKGIRLWEGGQWAVMVAEMGPKVRSMNAVQTGVSGDPKSPAYANQMQLLSERRLKPTYFYADELATHVSSQKTVKTR